MTTDKTTRSDQTGAPSPTTEPQEALGSTWTTETTTDVTGHMMPSTTDGELTTPTTTELNETRTTGTTPTRTETNTTGA